MAWLWTDTLAALLVEHDQVPAEMVAAWRDRPVAYRLDDGENPLALARALARAVLEEAGAAGPAVPADS